MVKTGHVICLATVIDKVHGTNRAKRVRLQSGEFSGEVRLPGQYDLLEFMDPESEHPPKALEEAVNDWALAQA